MSPLDTDFDAELNPNNSLDGEDITAGLKALRLPSRVSSNSSSRTPSVKSPVIPQGILPQAAPAAKSKLEELLTYVGNGDNDWGDDMPDFDFNKSDSFISLDNSVPDWLNVKPQKDINNPKVRAKPSKHKEDHHGHQKHQNHSHHQQQSQPSQQPQTNKHKKHGKKSNGLSSDAMRLMPVSGWKPEPVEFSDDDYEEDLGVENRQLETPPSSKGSVIHSKWSNGSLPTGPAKTTKRNSMVKHQKQPSREVHIPSRDPIPTIEKASQPDDVDIHVTRIRYTEDVKKEKAKEVVIKSKWA